MEGELAATRAAPDHGSGAIPRQILWQEVRILGYDGQLMHDFEYTADLFQAGVVL